VVNYRADRKTQRAAEIAAQRAATQKPTS